MQKTIIILFISTFFFTVMSFAQRDKARLNEKVEARRVAFITNRLDLTPEEAQQFWPLFNEYEADRKVINKGYSRKNNFSLLTDEEVEAHIEDQIELEEKQLALKKAYIYKLKEVIPIRKVAMLSRVEKRFKEWMLEQIKKRQRKN